MATQKQIEAALNAYLNCGDTPQEAMKAALEAAETEAWRPIETAPFESGKPFWLGKPDRLPIIAWRIYHDGPWLSQGISEVVEYTHWRQLPSPPEEK